MCTRCSTAQVAGRGFRSGPYSTRPEITTCAPSVPPPPPASRPKRTSALRGELAEIFRIEILQVGLELVRVQWGRPARFARRVAGIHRGHREQRIAGEDRRLQPQGERDGIRWPGIDLNDGVPAINMQ